MSIFRLRTAAIVLAAGIGLGGCATYSPFGYGSGVSVGIGNSGYYDPYYSSYGSRYGYGYGYSPYGYGAGYGYSPYWGWNNGYYYPGTGYYVYDQYRRRRTLTDAERAYWSERASRAGTTTTRRLLENWSGFGQTGTQSTQSGTSVQTTRALRGETRMSPRIRTDAQRSMNRAERATVRAERVSNRAERATIRAERAARRAERSKADHQ